MALLLVFVRTSGSFSPSSHFCPQEATAATARMVLEANTRINADSSSSSGRGADAIIVRVTPEVGPEGAGRIGVRLNSNAYIKHVRAKVSCASSNASVCRSYAR